MPHNQSLILWSTSQYQRITKLISALTEHYQARVPYIAVIWTHFAACPDNPPFKSASLPLPLHSQSFFTLTDFWLPRLLSRRTPAVCPLQQGTSRRTAPALWLRTRDRAPDCPYSRSGRFLVSHPGIPAALWSHWLASEEAQGSLSCAGSG